MIRFDFTHGDPVVDVALDEAILEFAESESTQGREHPELLRLWEPASPAVVLGRSSPFLEEVNHSFCKDHQVPVVRRCSGGQSIVTGPGCLMYAVLLNYQKRPELRMLDAAHEFVMKQICAAVEQLGAKASVSGTSDLTVAGRKVSGNSLRCKKEWMLYHGTLICNLDIEFIANCLGNPVRQPEYRSNRSHRDFLAQLNLDPSELKESIARQWRATPFDDYVWPVEKLNELLKTKYRSEAWNRKV
ncbi:MAG: lipoate--protein ligase family protein [Planctomycetota bacterium]